MKIIWTPRERKEERGGGIERGKKAGKEEHKEERSEKRKIEREEGNQKKIIGRWDFELLSFWINGFLPNLVIWLLSIVLDRTLLKSLHYVQIKNLQEQNIVDII